MCLKWFKEQKLPYPEETPDYSQTMENVNLDASIDKWAEDYHVPIENRSYWKIAIIIKLDNTISYPAQTYGLDGIRHLDVRPEWLNSGILAHEQSHNSYALLTEGERSSFAEENHRLSTMDKMIQMMRKEKRYSLTDDIEAHAEIYRYLGNQMPESLKKYYPKLF